jgi:phosphoribosylanthranilate isomerase
MACVDSSLWVKICGLTVPEQAVAIARQGSSAIGFIAVPKSPRYVTPLQMQAISEALVAAEYAQVERVGVFVDASLETLEVAAPDWSNSPPYSSTVKNPLLTASKFVSDCPR